MPDIRRIYDHPSMPESVVTLIDALGAYIRNMEDPVESEIEELSPALTAHLAKCKELLGELKEWELTPVCSVSDGSSRHSRFTSADLDPGTVRAQDARSHRQ